MHFGDAHEERALVFVIRKLHGAAGERRGQAQQGQPFEIELDRHF